MASSTVLLNISVQQQQLMVSYLWHVRARYTYFYSIRPMLLLADRVYYRENDLTFANQKAKQANNFGDADKFQNIQMPIAYEQVETWVGFMTAVFMTQVPIFKVVASPDFIDSANMINAVMSKQAKKGRWKSELVLFLRDCAKYSIGAVEVSWVRRRTVGLESDANGKAKQTNVVWEGNVIKRLDLYNTFWDTTVAPGDVSSKGEYAGYNELISRNRMKQIVADLGDEVIKANLGPAYGSDITKLRAKGANAGQDAFQSASMTSEFYIPQLNPEALASLNTLTMGMDWFSFAGMGGDTSADLTSYKGQYILTTIYVRLIPKEFGLKVPGPNIPQVWKWVIVNYSIPIYIERQTNVHEQIPIMFGCPNDDGNKYQTKALLANVKPMQAVGSALMNAQIHAEQRNLNDRALYNPLYIDKKTVENPNPSGKMPVKPMAYNGVPLDAIYHPIPFEYGSSAMRMQDIQTVRGMADMVAGQNAVQRGQFQKGNKTSAEFNSVMDNADGKTKVQAIVLEDQFFTPLKLVIESNILQYQADDTIYHKESDTNVKVDPVALRNAVYEFAITDGVDPASQEMNEDVWQTAMQTIGSSQAIQAEFNLADTFSYFMQVKGAPDILKFRKPPEQKMFEQAQAQWQATLVQLVKANPDIKAEQYPPQPKPTDYGLGTNGQPLPQSQSAMQTAAQKQQSLQSMLVGDMSKKMGGQEENGEPLQQPESQ